MKTKQLPLQILSIPDLRGHQDSGIERVKMGLTACLMLVCLSVADLRRLHDVQLLGFVF